MQFGALSIAQERGTEWRWVKGQPAAVLAVVFVPDRKFFSAQIEMADPDVGGPSDAVVLGKPIALIEAPRGRRFKLYDRIILMGMDFSPEPQVVSWSQMAPDARNEVEGAIIPPERARWAS